MRPAPGRHFHHNVIIPVEETRLISSPRASLSYDGVFSLIAINVMIFLLNAFGFTWIQNHLFLIHWDPSIWQFFTFSFCHRDYFHLSSNLFFIYIFGKLIEEESGHWALWATYVICGFWSGVASFLILPRCVSFYIPLVTFVSRSQVISIGASGSVFGLFVVSVALKMSWHWRRMLEAVILGQFVLSSVVHEMKQVTSGVGPNAPGQTFVNRVGHVAYVTNTTC
jgi:membrane associated rhomboid family serine protease